MHPPATELTVARQKFLAAQTSLSQALHQFSTGNTEARGAVFTKREVVDFILDLSGYATNRPLHKMRFLEPSFGGGDFLLPAIERLLTAWKSQGEGKPPLSELGDAIRAVELHAPTFKATRKKVVALLASYGIETPAAERIADYWLRNDDFLLTEIDGAFDFVVGNPPYVRQELIPDALIAEYRVRYETIYDRADLYIPFIEQSLSLLKKGGQLGFICADRWMKNHYGGPLRAFVATGFHLRIYVDMVGTAAFHSDVIAYPAITVISRCKPGLTRIAHRPVIDSRELTALAASLTAVRVPEDAATVKEIAGVVEAAKPWILESSDQLALVRRLEASFPLLEETGCKVGIGVATGADQAFIAPMDDLDVEADRKLPIVGTRDITSGAVRWQGNGVINPFSDEGGLVDLARYPKLRRFLEARRDQIANRHVAKKSPANWYRTIDRIYPDLVRQPKLLVPDIKGDAHIVYEDGKLYPHHNLYYITAEQWDLRALQAVLMSGIARLFVSIYSTKMHGGYLRFQAQYLRRIRVPLWSKVPAAIRRELVQAAKKGDQAACTQAVFALYEMTAAEQAALGGNGD